MATSITAIRVCYWLKSTMAYNELFYVGHFLTNELAKKKKLKLALFQEAYKFANCSTSTEINFPRILNNL